MLLAFQQIQILENKLIKQVNTNIIQDYRISLKTDMRVEVFILIANNPIFSSEDFNAAILEDLRFNKNAIEIIPITEREKNYDPLYKHIFSDKYPSHNSKVDVGLVWRFDTLLTNDSQVEKLENPCNVVTFYSYKGGMGRTTTLCSYAIHLAQKGKRVVVIDCDFEAPGFLNFFNTNKEQGQKSGLIEYLLDKEFLGKENLNLKNEYLIPVSPEYSGGTDNKIFVFPAGNLSYINSHVPENENSLNKSETLKLNLYHYIHGLARLNIANTENILFQFKELFKDLVESLELTKDDYILIDSRTGFNEIFGITALNLSDIIVSFFGSSEQTRAGLYFLLDKYRDLQRQPKLILVNSIIPNDEKVSKLFNDSFKRLLKSYEDFKESDWDISGSVPRFQLHENKVLKQIGVQFYEEEDLNTEKEKELIKLVKTNRFINDNGLEDDFKDLNHIFKQLDEFTTPVLKTIPINDLDNIQLRNIILKHLNSLLENDQEGENLKLWAELGEIEPNTFFYRECMKTLFKKEKFIIQGFKGSGKTYIYKSLKKKEITEIILAKSGLQLGKYEFIDIIALPKATDNLKEFPFKKEDIKNISHVNNFWKIYLWASVMLDIRNKAAFNSYRSEFPSVLESDIQNLALLKSQSRQNFFIDYLNDKSKIVEIDNDLENLNSFLRKENINLFVLFDRLDGIAKPSDWDTLITPLVDFWTDNINKEYFDRYYPKIFIRNDILEGGHIRTNNPRSIKNEYAFSIDWSRDEMYAYFFKLVFSEIRSKEAFFQIMRNYQEVPENIIKNIETDIEANNQLTVKEDFIKPLLNTFFGNNILSPTGKSLGNPYVFFFLNFSNANDTISIRPFINLISGAVKEALKDVESNKFSKPILHYIYSTNDTVRDKATQLHFNDLTEEAGDELRVIFDFIKYSLKKGDKIKSVVITFLEMNELLEMVLRSDEYLQLPNPIKDKEVLKKLLVISGIALNDDRYKVYRFAQMYKYWLGLSSRSQDTLQLGQRLTNRVANLSNNGFGYIETGYKSPDIYFHYTSLIGLKFEQLKIDDLVEFTVGKNQKGLAAINVRKISN